jgi:hypothetical protein
MCCTRAACVPPRGRPHHALAGLHAWRDRLLRRRRSGVLCFRDFQKILA